MKNLKIMYIISGMFFLILSILTLLINIEHVYNTPNLTIYIAKPIYVFVTASIFFGLFLFTFIAAIFHCNCKEEIFKNYLIKY